MKVLFDHPDPFLFAHGGFQTQIEQTKAALEAAGVEVEYLRWWDDQQKGEIIHYFGRPSPFYLGSAHQKKIKVVLAQILTGLGSRSTWLLPLQQAAIASARHLLPKIATGYFCWDSFQLADACVALTRWEATLMSRMFSAPAERVSVVPNGVEQVFLESHPTPRGQWLVCTATITERKRVLELAQASALAQTPVWIIGTPYSDTDTYARRFLVAAKQHPKFIRYEGGIRDRTQLAQIYRAARGFVLLSTKESLSLSALEAAACECPLLLSERPWATMEFREHATYCPIASPQRTAPVLRQFYDAAPGLKPPPKPLSWLEVGRQLKRVYEAMLSTSR